MPPTDGHPEVACAVREADRPAAFPASAPKGVTASAKRRKDGAGCFDVRVWGARGTLPGCSTNQGAYGTDTCCVEMEVGGHHLIFDAGTGIVPLGRRLWQDGVRRIDLFLSHVHYDHVMGLPFFKPFYDPAAVLSVTAGHMLDGRSCAEIVEDYMRAPFLPITPRIFTAGVDYRSFAPGDVLEPAPGVTIRTARLRHPNGAVGYRVEHAGLVVSYVTDTEHEPGATDADVLSLFREADVVFYDTTYTDAEMEGYKGFGHSSWQEGVRLAKAAGAKRLVLFHHGHNRDDEALAAILAEARRLFPRTFAGKVGMTFQLGSAADDPE